MITVCELASAVLDELTDGLEVGDSKKFDRGLGFMAVHVECLQQTSHGSLFSVAHYFEMAGDLVPDPDVLFLRLANGSWTPISFRSSIAYRVAVHFHEDESVEVDEREQRDLTRFANVWMKNVSEQQGLPTTRRTRRARRPSSLMGAFLSSPPSRRLTQRPALRAW